MGYERLTPSDWQEILLALEEAERVAGRKGMIEKVGLLAQNTRGLSTAVKSMFMDPEKCASVLSDVVHGVAQNPSWTPKSQALREMADRMLQGSGSARRSPRAPSGEPRRTSGGARGTALTRTQAEELLRRAYAEWPARAVA